MTSGELGKLHAKSKFGSQPHRLIRLIDSWPQNTASRVRGFESHCSNLPVDVFLTQLKSVTYSVLDAHWWIKGQNNFFFSPRRKTNATCLSYSHTLEGKQQSKVQDFFLLNTVSKIETLRRSVGGRGATHSQKCPIFWHQFLTNKGWGYSRQIDDQVFVPCWVIWFVIDESKCIL